MPNISDIDKYKLFFGCIILLFLLIVTSIIIYNQTSVTNQNSIPKTNEIVIIPATVPVTVPVTVPGTIAVTVPGTIPVTVPGSNSTNYQNKKIGLCYAYDKTKYQGTQCLDFEKLLIQDFQKMKAAGYDDIKTYWSYFGGEYGCLCDPVKGGMFAKIGSQIGMNLYLGVNPDAYPFDQWGFDVKKCILNSVRMYPQTVKGIIVGNENVNGNLEISKKIINVYKDLKQSLGTQVSIGTAQQNGYWVCMVQQKDFCKCDQKCQDAYRLLLDQLDFCGANIYPAPFPGTENKEMNKKTIIDQFNEMKQILGSKLWITETGIPGQGGTTPNQRFSKEIQTDLLNQINEWHKSNPSVPIFLFEAMNEPSKPDNIPDYNVEKYFGVL